MEVNAVAHNTDQIKVYLEIGGSKTFASALDWPGWNRSGRDEASALQALCDYGSRYARVLHGTRAGFHAPAEPSDLVVVERLKGNSTTDFGAPNLDLSSDTDPVTPPDLHRYEAILRACWRALDKAVEEAAGRTLKKGPRGGGRDLDKVMEHVQAVNAAYLSNLGGKLTLGEGASPGEALALVRKTILDTLIESVNGNISARGPRGGHRWTPRYFVRRLAWHELDHVWEIEDRAE